MTRYIENLPALPVCVLENMYARGMAEIDACAAQGNMDNASLSVNQVHFIGQLIEKKGGTIPEDA